MKTPMKIFALALASFGLTTAAVPALAESSDMATLVVSTAGLDLSSPEGQRILDRRIESAARKVCDNDRMRTGTRIPASEARQCVAKAAAIARKQVASIIEDQQRGG